VLIALIVVVVVVLVGVLWFVSQYNRLVALANGVDAAWANIDAQLKRRHDLVPNLVETTKGYAAHERETLDAVVAARNSAVTASGPRAAAAADGVLAGALRQLFALSEAYPDLKANQNFLELQRELAATENTIAAVRQLYNTAVQDLNTKREVFPTNLVAGSKPRFAAREYFEVADDTQREVPRVQF